MIYTYLAYLHIQGRGGAIRSETQGGRQECFNAAVLSVSAPTEDDLG